MKKYSELPYNLQCKICKDQLRPMAAQIFGHIYRAEQERGNQWLDDPSIIKQIAGKSVLAASSICAELNKTYGDQSDEPFDFNDFRDEEIEEDEKFWHDQENL